MERSLSEYQNASPGQTAHLFAARKLGASYQKHMDVNMRKTISVTTFALLVLSGGAIWPAEQIEYDRDVRPLLARHCTKCHGRSKAEGGLRLTDRSAAIRLLPSGTHAIKPGNAEGSGLWQRITATEKTERMPPDTPPLAAEEIALLRRWIEQGAEWPDHWAFQPIRNESLPASPGFKGARNGIDHFVWSRLKTAALRPSAEATRSVLLRRITLDTTGLPPTAVDMQQFLDALNPDFYERTADRLLASPHYGERWGRHWLDIARYADSEGYESDRPRPFAWRWREWVIETLNADMPFDRFTLQQIAGDLLPDATLDQRIATGFHRNTLVNREGGTNKEEDRVKRTVDRTNTVAKVWLGITLGCCQCHDHKYDPISQAEYYSFYGFFNSLDEPNLPAALPEQITNYLRQSEDYQQQRNTLIAAIAEYSSDKLTQWDEQLKHSSGIAQWETLKPRSARSTIGMVLKVAPDQSVFVQGGNDKADVYTIESDTTRKGITSVRLQVLADARLPAQGPGLPSNGNFVLTGLRVFVAPIKNPDQREEIRVVSARADFSQAGRNIQSVLGNGRDDGWAVHPQTGRDHVAIFDLDRAVGFPGGTRITIQMEHFCHEDHNLGKFRLGITSTPAPAAIGPPDTTILEILGKGRARRTDEEQFRLLSYYKYVEPTLEPLFKKVDALTVAKPKDPGEQTMAQVIQEANSRRTTHVLVRGDFLNPGKPVSLGVPATLQKLVPRGIHADRIDLARWLVAQDNPLTARVLANRLWQRFFGRGLVTTEDDFGTQGSAPSHPALLDWLATRLRDDHHWSIKQLQKTILLSATYRQSSRTSPQRLNQDPENRLLGRQARLRVEAEIVRDLVLASGNLLDRRIGGPSVRPPQPADLVKLGFQTSLSWKVSTGGDRYRRGLYTFFQRTVPYPALIMFDAADSNTSCTRRERSNTALQALTTWNDPVFVEAAIACGRRLLDEVAPGDFSRAAQQQRIRHAAHLCLSRALTEQEFAVLSELADSQYTRYRQDTAAALKSINTAGIPHDEAAQWAAYTAVARTLMNLDEFITRE